jgi:hypothetical protein
MHLPKWLRGRSEYMGPRENEEIEDREPAFNAFPGFFYPWLRIKEIRVSDDALTSPSGDPLRLVTLTVVLPPFEKSVAFLCPAGTAIGLFEHSPGQLEFHLEANELCEFIVEGLYVSTHGSESGLVYCQTESTDRFQSLIDATRRSNAFVPELEDQS